MQRSLIVAVVLAMAMAVWLAGGQQVRAKQAAPSGVKGGEPALTLPRVQVKQFALQSIQREIVLQGQTQPLRVATLKSETTGRVVALPAERGQRVELGAALVHLSPEDRGARRRLAQAGVAQAEAALFAAKALNKKGYQADLQVKEANAQQQGALAELAAIELDIQHTILQAPFAGVVRERFVELGEYVAPGDAVVELLDDSSVKVVADLPQQKLSSIHVGMVGQANWLDGRRRSGAVGYISPLADAQTRTYRVELRVDNPDGTLPLGASVEIVLSLGAVQAHHLSPALLNLDAHGNLGVKAVDAQQQVVWYGVQVVQAGLDGIWVTGLPEGVSIITLGGGFVKVGQQVTPRQSS
ncbi:efflux transporter, RND family, MFP subunit [Magnetococcus marinus MC-1]|uniref:Efflux transporter, RND family, MFP subunit n=1 Tax=Magnetococcus marinus (strain ATCC BAA-1437 / JCM 17883 / MC-1) TaxID=156889 RepID=A0LAL8_MAGMM|nr:efflux RND transporter periplasmic adaptor subunit [Magnetococcus marinus]ABK45011.1 efflux transporter, RND family, MFP subunit [Magnetococcus marinus MC-1]